MAAADHLYVSYRFYTHHGIDIGDGTVIHLSRSRGGITRSSLDEFTDDRRLHVQHWPLADAPDTVLARAQSYLGAAKYDLFHANCEHFASWCKTGVAESAQVARVRRRAGAIRGKLAARSLAKGSIKLVGPVAVRSASPALLAADVAQFGTETYLSHRGVKPETADAVGMGVGLTGSVAIGAALGGPIGACVGAGIWAAGEAIGRQAVRATSPRVQPQG